jgi:hypothetical protein
MLGAKHDLQCEDEGMEGAFWDDATQAAGGPLCKNQPEFELATLTQCLQFVQEEDLTGCKLPMRMYVWHRINDDRMHSNRRTLTNDETANLLALLDIWGAQDDHEALLRAEIFRELGRFNEAAQVLGGEISMEMAGRAEQIMQAIERQDDQPFIFALEHDGGDVEFTLAWMARRGE